MKKRKACILLVEDSLPDQKFVQRAFEDGKIDCDLLIANNGKEAVSMLLGEEPYEDSLHTLPDLILMDINMPIMDGKEALAFIRANSHLKHLPVVMLTTSNYEKDILESYQLGVNAYLTKPIADSEFLHIIHQLENFWFELVVLPN